MMDPDRLETQPSLNEALDDIVVAGALPSADEDWMAGEFDIT
jgi:hypothetical protein